MPRNMPNQAIVDFIAIYRSEPCLWQVKSHDYHDRMKNDAAYAKLAKKLDEIEPGVDKKSVINKINSLRSAFRKEKEKVDASNKSGASTDSIYKPVLWYYDLFNYSQDQDTPRTTTSNLDSESDKESVDNPLPVENRKANDKDSTTAVVQEVATQPKQPITSRPGSNKRQKKNEELTAETLMTARDHFKTPKEQFDRFDLLGKTIAVKLRGLEKRQALIAEKKISDILFEAEMGSLKTPSMYPYSSSVSQSPDIIPCPTPSPTYGQDSFTSVASQSPNITPCPTPSPTYGQDSFTPVASQNPNVNSCPTPSPIYGQDSFTSVASQNPNITPCPTYGGGSFTQIHNDGSARLLFSSDSTASSYFSQFNA